MDPGIVDMTILVTGGTGFIGSYIVKQLVDEGENPVALDLQPNPLLIKDIENEVDIVRMDLLHLEELLTLIKEKQIDRIIHTAFLLAPLSEVPLNAYKVNSGMTMTVLEAARIMDLERVVRASSVAAYGPRTNLEEVVSEDSCLNPSSLYGLCKAFDDRIGLQYVKKYSLDVLGLRIGPQYGHSYGRRGGGVLYDELIEKPIRGLEPIRVPGGLDRVENLTYVKDGAIAFVKACRVDKTEHKIFNATGHVYSYREIVNELIKYIPKAKVETIPIPSEATPLPIRFDIKKAEVELGWKPKYDLASAIKETIELNKKTWGL